MLFNNMVTHGKAQTRALTGVFGSIKRLKNAGQVIRGNPPAIISYRNAHLIPDCTAGYANLARSLVEGVDRVDQ